MRMKRMMAALLAAAMVMGSALTATAAATSSTKDGDTSSVVDPNSNDHTGNTVTSDVKNGTATVTKCTSDGSDEGKAVEFKVAEDPATKQKVDITVIGDGKKGVFDSKAGRKVTSMNVNSAASTVTIKKNALKGSKIKTIKVATKKLVVKKGAFNKTKQKKIVIKFVGKKSGALTVKKGSLKGLTKITVKGLSKKEFKKVKKKLQKAGFKGTIKKG